MEEKKKFNWTELIAVTTLVFLAALVSFGITWYIMDNQLRDVQSANDAAVASYQARIAALEAKAQTPKASADTHSSTSQTTTTSKISYTNSTCAFSFQYPSSYKVTQGLAQNVYRTIDNLTSGDKAIKVTCTWADENLVKSWSTVNIGSTTFYTMKNAGGTQYSYPVGGTGQNAYLISIADVSNSAATDIYDILKTFKVN